MDLKQKLARRVAKQIKSGELMSYKEWLRRLRAGVKKKCQSKAK